MNITGIKIYSLIFFSIVFMPMFALAAGPSATIVEKETKYGHISYPQISGLADKNIQDSINNNIIEIAATWTCDFDGETGDPERMDYDAWTNLYLIDERYLSFTVSQDYFCGGAHPNQQIDAYNYNLKEGHPIPINGLLVPEMLDENLSSFLLSNHKFDVDGCGDAYPNINWDYYRTKDKIVFLPRLSRISQTCFEEFPVPIKDLETYMWSEMEEDRN